MAGAGDTHIGAGAGVGAEDTGVVRDGAGAAGTVVQDGATVVAMAMATMAAALPAAGFTAEVLIAVEGSTVAASMVEVDSTVEVGSMAEGDSMVVVDPTVEADAAEGITLTSLADGWQHCAAGHFS